MLTLARGQKTPLAALTRARTLDVGIALAAPGGAALDVSCFGVDATGRLADDRYFVFYNQRRSPEGALAQLGAADGDAERFRVALDQLPTAVARLVFVATLDGPGTMRQVAAGHVRLLAAGAEVARLPLSGDDFGDERALMLAELYRRDGGWRVAAVGQGFAGGLDALLAHFGGTAVDAPGDPTSNVRGVAPSGTPAGTPSRPAPTTAVPPSPAGRADLETRLAAQAPGLVSLVKQARVSLEKRGLGTHRARVALCLDISGSMKTLYASGAIQRLAEKVLALGLRIDDDGAVDVFLFGEHPHAVGPMSLENFHGFVPRCLVEYPLEGGTNYGRAIRCIRQHYFPDGLGKGRLAPVAAETPVYVLFLTDGRTDDRDMTVRHLTWASFEPIFWQFVGIGRSAKAADGSRAAFGAGDFPFLERLDTLEGRYVDNANFFSVQHPDDVPDAQLFDWLMAEYPDWARLAPTKGLLPAP